MTTLPYTAAEILAMPNGAMKMHSKMVYIERKLAILCKERGITNSKADAKKRGAIRKEVAAEVGLI